MRYIRSVICVMIAAATVPVTAQVAKPLPHFASIAPGKARMRTGPGRTYPASWVYQRADLPVKVLDTFAGGTWVKIEDPAGEQGWMLRSLVSDTRTGMVIGTVADLRETPDAAARVRWRVSPDVVGRLSQCANGWCWFDVKGQGGFIEANRLWGVTSDERF